MGVVENLKDVADQLGPHRAQQSGRVAQAFELAGISNKVGAPSLRTPQGRESEMSAHGRITSRPAQSQLPPSSPS
jgi:hypothetical protein